MICSINSAILKIKFIFLFLGMDILNSAIESICKRVPPEKWEFVSVAVAPSTITITEHGVSLSIVIADAQLNIMAL